jgi:hypothetical protein
MEVSGKSQSTIISVGIVSICNAAGPSRGRWMVGKGFSNRPSYCDQSPGACEQPLVDERAFSEWGMQGWFCRGSLITQGMGMIFHLTLW